VSRSDSPHAFAALGPKAAELLAPHPVEVPHGLNSPVGRAYELDADVLLLGVGHDANTTIHLAENIAGVPYRQAKYATVMRDGHPARCDYEEIDHCCANFALMDAWLDARGLQRRGLVDGAEARWVRSRDVVATALDQLRANDTTFLHPRGVCMECDDAWASLGSIPDAGTALPR
jgi:aminoglycoside 3-N-acetyltransferase